MAGYRKLGRTSSQRKALLRNEVTDLLYYGKIQTTEAKAKEVRKIAEKLIALGVRERDNYEEVTVQAKAVRKDAEGKRIKENGALVYDTIEKKIRKDAPSRLHARRQIAKAVYVKKEIPEKVAKKKANTKSVDIAEKLFNELGPKYANRQGGYTRIIKIGPRKGDAAMQVVIELV
ncbi:MAG: 50S ribosomal protein L17 [Lachnospiraceae bacterium]|nr:50S ribosomal protein L17 [Lachnospiraceae bacterium]